LRAAVDNGLHPVTIQLGTGNDVVELTAGNGLNNNCVITLGGGTDTVKVDGICANGQSYDSIAGFIKGDTLDLSTINLGASAFTKTALTLAATAVFQDYLDAVCATNASSSGVFGWFQWNGDSYLVEDRSAAATFQNGSDFVIKLAGLVDLSKAAGTDASGAFGGDGILIGG
jgi:S-layer protein